MTVVGPPPVRLSALAFVFSSQHALPVADRLMRDLKDVSDLNYSRAPDVPRD